MIDLVCQLCGKPYKRRDDRAQASRYCSGDCQRAAKRSKLEIPCSTCGKMVRCKKTLIAKQESFYCSVKCKADGQRKVSRLVCCVCGKSFDRHPSHIRQGIARGHKPEYCGVECRGLAKRNRVKIQCDYCGVTMERPASGARGGHNFCSEPCRAAWRTKNMSGENACTWKGGWKSYYGPNWNEQSRLARERDGDTCQHCGKTAEQNQRHMDVHHIRPFREFGYIHGQNSNYLQANQLTNLITLCRSCHGRADAGKPS